ncbi:hypothetical protein SAMN00017405_1736 [Desulfonispora thiosulfatigenes DSM 11270]|uniref:Uncharacterized protein n=1 Tax=Desulfonispora thiosulfatigenes DSM 11270 TaxID=656914 RepID=A0A1W1V2V4_DESTI|nr:hypothetical protein [Desulfonispora thiosulfatigenes]SMB87663.1 hypothetical protein SAMN00017405_1736 [Desulfonispora thiosulfatigenes DSM 11270]
MDTILECKGLTKKFGTKIALENINLNITGGQIGASTYLLAFEIIIAALLILASIILIVYASIAIGQLFNKHKILASFGAFIGLIILEEMLSTIIGMFPGVVYFTDIPNLTPDLLGMGSFISLANTYRIIITAIFCIVYFAITNFILSKRLNLE